MDGSSPPSFTGPSAETTYSQDDQYYAAGTGPQSFSDMNTGRPVSVSHDQPHMRAIDGDPNMKRQPTFKDVAPGLGQSYKVPSADAGDVNRGPVVDVIQDGEKPQTIGDLAAARKPTSGTEGRSPYEEVKVPTNGDMRPNNPSPGYELSGGWLSVRAGSKELQRRPLWEILLAGDLD
ncbi:hypothetical protein L2E82_34616 [Cichorium intybus]|uniref:Uncharacterized protein n=1 Tax=Cichorium intybus TaxID=13427 RepID=A0ACB9BMF0_CICIN|nr:hypothetical protein L2E82_34616 [Cichorium intybus]